MTGYVIHIACDYHMTVTWLMHAMSYVIVMSESCDSRVTVYPCVFCAPGIHSLVSHHLQNKDGRHECVCVHVCVCVCMCVRVCVCACMKKLRFAFTTWWQWKQLKLTNRLWKLQSKMILWLQTAVEKNKEAHSYTAEERKGGGCVPSLIPSPFHFPNGLGMRLVITFSVELDTQEKKRVIMGLGSV